MYSNTSFRIFVSRIGLAALFCTCSAFAQTKAVHLSLPAPVTFTSTQDHQNMMDQLGIKALRPGPSGDEKSPDHANYDEKIANPFPDLPDALRLNDGKTVTTAKEWWEERRPQIVNDFETHDASLIWEGHKAGRHIGYCHIEKLQNLEALPPTGFTVSCFPTKIERASAGWTRAVAIVES